MRPLLLAKCQTCHGPKLQQGGLRLDSREALLRGGSSGAALVPGKAEASLLLQRVRHSDASLRMPPGERVSDADVANLITWIKAGAPWPAAGVGSQGSRAGGDEKAKLWAFQPVRTPQIPTVKNRGWVKTPVDAFILAGLEAKGLKPSPPADRRTLIRRATFDLTGLPPTPEEIAQFERECNEERGRESGAGSRGKLNRASGAPPPILDSRPPAPRAYARLIDRLLSSPRYGEKWGRHWLDCVRYADSNGLDENYHYANAWRYRDYVIDAFNRDLPYDQFLREQLAGDLLPPSPQLAENYRRTVATGFYLLGPKLLANPDKVQVLADIIDEQIDVTSRSMLGVTLACARCHDHKFDPFSQKDYYAVAGIFRSTRSMVSLKDRIWSELPLAPADVAARAEAHQKALEEKKKELESATKGKAAPGRIAALEAEIRDLEKATPPVVPYALAVVDGAAMDVPLYVRGDHNNPGEVVRRGFPAVLVRGGQPRLDAARSGRLELARWISSPENPLTARVMVNRVWQWHFGEGLVRTSDNFGALGEQPSNPALLDWLAGSFARGEVRGERLEGKSAAPSPLSSSLSPEARPWSLKRLHRLLMLSSAYQMSSAYDERAHTADADNRLLWRMSRRRLSAEEQRDAMLSVTGELDVTMGGSLLDVPNKVRVTTDGSDDLAAKSYDGHRRSIYLPVIRNSLYEMLELFDFADASAVTTRRSETIASPQALFLMNHPFMLQRAERFAARLLDNPALDDAGRVRDAYVLTFGRTPSTREVRTMTDYLREYARELEPTLPDPLARRRRAWQSLCQTLLCANEFLYVD